MPTSSENRPWIIAALAALWLGVVIFIGYSYGTSERMDRIAADSGGSTDPWAPNTLQDRAARPPSNPTTGARSSNVPPATAQQ